jgi:predicted RNA-binding protein with EMAP domain
MQKQKIYVLITERSSKFLPTPAAGVGTEEWQKNLCKSCVGNVHVNLANWKYSYISLDDLVLFNVIT